MKRYLARIRSFENFLTIYGGWIAIWHGIAIVTTVDERAGIRYFNVDSRGCWFAITSENYTPIRSLCTYRRIDAFHFHTLLLFVENFRRSLRTIVKFDKNRWKSERKRIFLFDVSGSFEQNIRLISSWTFVSWRKCNVITKSRVKVTKVLAKILQRLT